jgi:hypothetical protein
MFTKISRYRKVPDVTAPDAQGRVLASKGLRLLPSVTGTFRHTVESGDRLDQLAYKYYSEPLQWWNIADANPAFLSPLSLLGRDAVVATRFPVTVAGVPPWSNLFRVLRAMLGIEDVEVEEDVQLKLKQVTVGGHTITALMEEFSRTVIVSHNKRNVTAAMLASAIETAGFQVAQEFAEVDQVGQEIIVPAKPTG